MGSESGPISKREQLLSAAELTVGKSSTQGEHLVEVVPVVNEGLGNASYLVDLGDGLAAVIDPQRDLSPYLSLAREHHLALAFAVETHVHADFVTGSRELAYAGARIVAAASAGLGFEHAGLRDGQRLGLGDLSLELLATPGHTPDHASWLLLDGESPLGVFTGGALVVGGVARTDLAGADRTEHWARAAYRSLHHRLLTLPDALPVWPTHGPGSFCSTGSSSERTSTIGQERERNPLLAGNPDEDEFVRRLLGGLGTYPAYFDWLPSYNKSGPVVFGEHWPVLAQLTLPEFTRAVDDGAQVIDVRMVSAFSEGHVPASISHELRPQFASWLGWLADPTRPLAFITDASTDRAELVGQCVSIGYEKIAGELAGGMDTWRSAGRQVAHLPLVDIDALADWQVLDIRQSSEWDAGHVPGAVHRELGTVPGSELPADRATAVMCAHGQRSMTAASLIARDRGSTDQLAVFPGSAQDWAERTGHHLDQ